jgi:hypothetical protein
VKEWWNNKALPWLQKNWKWIVLPVGLLMLVGRVLSERKTTVVSSELSGAAEVEKKADQVMETQVAVAKATEVAQVDAAGEARERAMRALTGEERTKVNELVGDPVALNEYLKNTGKSVRKP